MADRPGLSYRVIDWSSFVAGYHPKKILENDQTDQSSRWLSETTGSPQSLQYLTLELEPTAIVKSITFSKFSRSHACNIKRVRVEGGMEKEAMTVLFEGMLHNDTVPETLSLRHSVGGHCFPSKYIKIIPLQSWGQTNFSVWHVALDGDTSPTAVSEATQYLKSYREKQALRLCLKHLRQFDYDEAFNELQKKACVSLEHPSLSSLHLELVEMGDYSKAEESFKQAVESGLTDEFIASQPITAVWQHIWPSSESSSWPGMRGGHQLCIDPIKQLLFLHGGWDGSVELADFWKYDIEKQQWLCISLDTSLEGGPTARSCHKMCFDGENEVVYVLGRYLDQDSRNNVLSSTIPGDFYSYNIHNGSWTLLSSDTFADGGPHLIYDHQMCFSQSCSTLYVFGGRVVSSRLQDACYSGLYAYHCLNKQWVCLRVDYTEGTYPDMLIPRMAHCMLLDEVEQQLYIIGGQRNKTQLKDMLVYNIKADHTQLLCDDGNHIGAGYTVMATIDTACKEITVLQCSLKVDKGFASEELSSSVLWLFQIATGSWINVEEQLTKINSVWPAPRFAHQLVYDPIKRHQYMFGGNPGCNQTVQMRLDDLWSLKLRRQSRQSLFHQCQYWLRQSRYKELVSSDPSAALYYLQNSVAKIVNHENADESLEFRQLVTQLFISDGDDCHREARVKLFDKLMSYFPDHMTAPKSSLIDLIKY